MVLRRRTGREDAGSRGKGTDHQAAPSVRIGRIDRQLESRGKT